MGSRLVGGNLWTQWEVKGLYGNFAAIEGRQDGKDNRSFLI